MVRLPSRPALVGAVAITIAFAAAGCQASAPPPPKDVSATLKEFAVSLSSAKAAPGSVTFTIKNDGIITHEFVVVKSDLASDKLPSSADGKVDEESSELTGIDEVEDIAAGSTKSLTVDLTAGHYVLICNLPGHYSGGMRASLEVSPS
jgi:uncharacterized cupredoxin-like copper-binding protein